MLEIIKEWLIEKIGINIDFNQTNFGNVARDGHLVAVILREFEVITEEELSMIEVTNDREEASNNFFNYILIWLARINLRVKDVELRGILNGNEHSALNLFHELYLALQDKSKLNFITRKRILEECHNEKSRFVVNRLEEPKIQEFKVEPSPLFQTITENVDILKWHKKRLILLKELRRKARENYENYVKSKQLENPILDYLCCCGCRKFEEQKSSNPSLPDVASQDFTLEELEEQYARSMKVESYPNVRYPNVAQAYIDQLKLKTRVKRKTEIEKLKTQQQLCETLKDKMEAAKKEEMQKLIEEDLLDQTHYEKQMMTKLAQVKHQQNEVKKKIKKAERRVAKAKQKRVKEEIVMEEILINECLCDYFKEQRRLRALHRHIDNEKIKLKNEIKMKICREAAADLVDFALYLAEFQENYKDPPSKRLYEQWIGLFVSGGRILPQVVPTEDILQDLTDLPEKDEDRYAEEIERQEIMDQNDYEKYQKTERPWQIDDEMNVKYNFKLIERDINVVGALVYNLWITQNKPLHTTKDKNFEFLYNVCLNRLEDLSSVKKLKTLLAPLDVDVFEIRDVLNFCLTRYKTEKRPDEVEDIQSLDLLEQASKKSRRNKKKSGRRAKKTKKGKKSLEERPKLKENLEEDKNLKFNKRHQTPRMFPAEEVIMSKAAQLGELAQKSMEAGEVFTDYLLAAMLVEYLRSLEGKKGWVLTNFPTTLEQAVTLEEHLNSTTLPKGSKVIKSILDFTGIKGEDLDHIYEGNGCPLKIGEATMPSKLFPSPPIIEEALAFHTFLTGYIKTVPITEGVVEAEETLPPVAKFLKDSESPLERFYADQGCCYFLYHEGAIDDPALIYLAKLILGINSIMSSPSFDLTMDFSTSKRIYSAQKIVELVEEEIVEETTPSEVVEEAAEEIKIEPGEPLWKYVEITIPDQEVALMLKHCETMEEIYENDLKQVLFMRRLVLGNIQPYVSYVRDHLMDLVNRPNDHQTILREFQAFFNDFSDNLRGDEELKSELHCKVEEFRNTLLSVVETEAAAIEGELKRIIEEHWLRKQLHELCQVYACGIQLEIDRFAATLQLATDYYTVAIQGALPANSPHKFDFEAIPNNHHHARWSDAYDIHFFNEKLSQGVTKCNDYIEKYSTTIRKLLHAAQTKTAKGKKKKKGKKSPRVDDVVQPEPQYDRMLEEWKTVIEGERERTLFRLSLLKRDSEKRLRDCADRLRTLNAFVLEEIRKNCLGKKGNVETVCEVFRAAIENEVPIQEELRIGADGFYVDPNVLLFPDAEPSAVASTPPLERATSSASSQSEKRLDVTPISLSPQPSKVWNAAWDFSLVQLEEFRRLMMDKAPKGIIPERMFTFLLQELIVEKLEMGKEPSVPGAWRQLSTLELENLIDLLFGRSAWVNWKDFLVFNLMIRMPTTEELLAMKREFAAIDEFWTDAIPCEAYDAFTFWFETELDDVGEATAIKNIIRNMYKIDGESINYTRFLVDFCKAKEAVSGFTKLLSVISDYPVCEEQEFGERYVEYQMSLRGPREEVVEENKDISERALEENEVISERVLEENEDISERVLEEMKEEVEPEDSCICDESCHCSQTTVSLVPSRIGFGEEFHPPMKYLLRFETIEKAAELGFGWQSSVYSNFLERARKIFDKYRNPFFNDVVLSHQLLYDDDFYELVRNTYKFEDKTPSHLIAALLYSRLPSE